MPYSSLHSLTSPPLGFTLAPSVAEVCVIDDAAPVATVGGLGGVVNAAIPSGVPTPVGPS